MRIVLAICFFLVASQAFAAPDEGKLTLKDGSQVLEIRVGSEKATSAEMSSRIRDLEEAVYELQHRLYAIERDDHHRSDRDGDNNQKGPEWSCTIDAMGEQFIGVGKTRALAEKKAVDDCKVSQRPFFCRDAVCSK